MVPPLSWVDWPPLSWGESLPLLHELETGDEEGAEDDEEDDGESSSLTPIVTVGTLETVRQGIDFPSL